MLLLPKKQFHHPQQQLWKHTNKQTNNLFYHIQNEIYSMKSYVVNFHVQMSSSLKVRGVNNGFHEWKEKNDTSNQNPEWCFSKFFLGNWSAIVLYISLSMKKIVESWQNNSRRGQTKRDVSLNWTFYWSFFTLLGNWPLTALWRFEQPNVQ